MAIPLQDCVLVTDEVRVTVCAHVQLTDSSTPVKRRLDLRTMATSSVTRASWFLSGLVMIVCSPPFPGPLAGSFALCDPVRPPRWFGSAANSGVLPARRGRRLGELSAVALTFANSPGLFLPVRCVAFTVEAEHRVARLGVVTPLQAVTLERATVRLRREPEAVVTPAAGVC